MDILQWSKTLAPICFPFLVLFLSGTLTMDARLGGEGGAAFLPLDTWVVSSVGQHGKEGGASGFLPGLCLTKYAPYVLWRYAHILTYDVIQNINRHWHFYSPTYLLDCPYLLIFSATLRWKTLNQFWAEKREWKLDFQFLNLAFKCCVTCTWLRCHLSNHNLLILETGLFSTWHILCLAPGCAMTHALHWMGEKVE